MKKVLPDFITALLILLFIYSGFSKIIAYAEFSRSMHSQPFAPWMADTLTWILPPIEIIIALMLMWAKTRRLGQYAFLITMLAFTGYIVAIRLNFFDRIPCSCGGLIRQLSWQQHLIFNLFFVGLAIWAIILDRQNHKVFEENK